MTEKFMTHEIKVIEATKLRAVSPNAIIAANLIQLTNELNDGAKLNPENIKKLNETKLLATGLENYIEKCTTEESLELKQLIESTNQINWQDVYKSGETTLQLESEMVSGHVEGQFLKFLIHIMQARRILEIGVFTGYSALAMAEALPDDGHLVACDIDLYAANFARKQFDRSVHGKKIKVIVGDAAQSIEKLSNDGETFDFIFIDADKPGYQTYLDIILQGTLLTKNGVICVDNTLMQGQPYMSVEKTLNGEAIEKFNLNLLKDPRVEQVMIPLRDGITMIRKV